MLAHDSAQEHWFPLVKCIDLSTVIKSQRTRIYVNLELSIGSSLTFPLWPNCVTVLHVRYGLTQYTVWHWLRACFRNVTVPNHVVMLWWWWGFERLITMHQSLLRSLSYNNISESFELLFSIKLAQTLPKQSRYDAVYTVYVLCIWFCLVAPVWSDLFSPTPAVRSGHELMVVDIQGVGDLYTDPQMHTADGRWQQRRTLGRQQWTNETPHFLIFTYGVWVLHRKNRLKIPSSLWSRPECGADIARFGWQG